MRRLLAALPIASLSLVPAHAQTAQECISKALVADMSVVLFPNVIRESAVRCSPHLPHTAFLRQPASEQFASKLKESGYRRLTSAVQAIRAIRNKQVADGVDEAMLVQQIGGELNAAIFKRLDREGCHNIDTLLEAISAMTPDQVGRFSSSLFALAKVDKPSICNS